MSLALTDLLIDVTDPTRMKMFTSDPEAFMKSFGLSDDEKAALRTGTASKIRLHATSVLVKPLDPDEYRQFTSARAASFNPALVEIDPVVEVHLQENEQVAITGRGQLFIDNLGQMYRGVPA